MAAFFALVVAPSGARRRL
ncbi:hypothetical protein F0357_23845 [Rhizobiales bacterium Sp-1]|uniref:Uncharacterized protein n=1 Tax=Segnochrobactrum spirostomi TaxID=2608987 RepID=A0A6A7YBE0_9HYPH|nr:hypothetical protein [Segnochrobactrum spirostomi]